MLTRAEYLDRLRLALRDMPRPLLDEILLDFEAHFREALTAGRNERQAAARLGDPLEIAGELRAACAA